MKEIVESAAYRALLADPDLPELARSFLCSSMIFEEYEEEAFAARSAIEAAWVCDDHGLHEAAVRCRLRAVERLRESQADGDELYEDPSTEYAVIVDLLRRAGQLRGSRRGGRRCARRGGGRGRRRARVLTVARACTRLREIHR